MYRLRLLTPASLLLACVWLVGCATNPVTGESNLLLVSGEDATQLGIQQYGPMKQSQGGEFTADESLSDYVNEVGQRVAAVSDNPLPYEFVVLNNPVPNAWALPGGKIAINRGLLTELDNEAELAAVLGHEVVHAAALHGAQAMSRGTLLQGALVVGALASAGNEYQDYIVGASQVGAQLISQRYSRGAESEADYYGINYMVEAGYDPRAAISLQETFVELSQGQNPGWLQGLFASHPPSQDRVEANRARVNELAPTVQGRDLEVGEDRYRQAISFLTENQEAYALFDEAQRDIANDDLENAMTKLDRAISMVPSEARFSGLKADILLYQGRYREAISTYDDALTKDDGYFDYYLGRGVAYSRRGEESMARQDLERSVELLPTAVAMNELGTMALTDGQHDAAKQYFQVAAQGGGTVAQQAALAYTRLDIQDNPAMYVQAQAFADTTGRVFARVSNRSPYPLQNVTVQFSAALGNQLAQQARRIQALGAGQTVDIDSGLVFPPQTDWNQARAVVVSASVQ